MPFVVYLILVIIITQENSPLQLVTIVDEDGTREEKSPEQNQLIVFGVLSVITQILNFYFGKLTIENIHSNYTNGRSFAVFSWISVDIVTFFLIAAYLIE